MPVDIRMMTLCMPLIWRIIWYTYHNESLLVLAEAVKESCFVVCWIFCHRELHIDDYPGHSLMTNETWTDNDFLARQLLVTSIDFPQILPIYLFAWGQ
ncbi:MAG: hypothetical protein CL607_12345 [Anaerolineaceae bacterium]|nr:hypothetical protein [Anaerolineaceae bacterium]